MGQLVANLLTVQPSGEFKYSDLKSVVSQIFHKYFELQRQAKDRHRTVEQHAGDLADQVMTLMLHFRRLCQNRVKRRQALSNLSERQLEHMDKLLNMCSIYEESDDEAAEPAMSSTPPSSKRSRLVRSPSPQRQSPPRTSYYPSPAGSLPPTQEIMEAVADVMEERQGPAAAAGGGLLAQALAASPVPPRKKAVKAQMEEAGVGPQAKAKAKAQAKEEADVQSKKQAGLKSLAKAKAKPKAKGCSASPHIVKLRVSQALTGNVRTYLTGTLRGEDKPKLLLEISLKSSEFHSALVQKGMALVVSKNLDYSQARSLKQQLLSCEGEGEDIS